MDRQIHKDHRKRVRNEILTNGIGEGISLHKIIEMLLYYSIPRKDTNETAHLLAERFGNISAMLDADVSELKEIEGIGDNTVALFKLIKATVKLYYSEKSKAPESFQSVDKIYEFLKSKYIGFSKEMFSVLCFDGAGSLLGFEFISSGDVAAVGISTRMVIEKAIKYNATAIILVHNHPSGIALPSFDDIKTTEIINNALKNIDIKLLDHLILGKGDYVSLVQSEKYKHIFN